MLTGVHMVFIGGDARQLEVIQACIDMDATVTLIGFEHLQKEFVGATKKSLTPKIMESADALVLPIVGTDNEGKITTVFGEGDLKLMREHIQCLPESAKVYTGMAKPYLKDLCRSYSIPVEELLSRDEVAIYNSIPTAEGAIMMAIQHTDFTIHGSRIAVLGYGRTGMTLARLLQAMGAHVKMGVHRQDHYARAYETRLEPFYTRDIEKAVEDVDLVFNTIPKFILTAPVLTHLRPHVFIIDLASAPGGTDFRFAEKRGIQAMLAPSLPGIVAPKTAGEIIASSLIQLVKQQMGKREDG